MPKDDLTAVQQEAYLHTDSHLVTLHTLEIRHSSFSAPARVVRDNTDLLARLEVGAPVDANTYQTFTAVYFGFTPPEISSEPDPTFKVTVDNVNQVLTPEIELATGGLSNEPIKVTYRSYVYNNITEALDNSDYPSATPLHMEVFDAIIRDNHVEFTISMVPIANRPFPFKKYTPEQFPGLMP